MAGLGDRLATVRRELGRTQAQMARGLEMALSTYQSYESDEKSPKSRVLEKLCELGVDGHWLLTGEGSMRRGEADSAPVAEPSARFDESLMRNCIIAVEELLDELDAGMPPDKKAELISLVYRLEIEERGKGTGAARPAQIIRLFKQVAG